MKYQQLNVQTTIFLFVDLMFNIISLFPAYIVNSRRPVLLFGLRFAICFLQFIFFMLLPKSTISFTKRRDFLAHNRIQQIKQSFINLNFVNLFVSMYVRASMQYCAFGKLVQYYLIILTPASSAYVVFNIILLVVFVMYEEVACGQAKAFIFISCSLLLAAGLFQYFCILNKTTEQIQMNYNINKEIDKIFAYQPVKQIKYNDSFSDNNTNSRQIYLDFVFRSQDDEERMVTKYSAMYDTIKIVASMFNCKLNRGSIDYGSIVFDHFMNYDLRHFAVCADILQEMAEQYEIEITIVIGYDNQINEKLLTEFDPGIYIVEIKEFYYQIEEMEEDSYGEVMHCMESIQRSNNLEIDEKIDIFKRIIKMFPPQFNILGFYYFKYHGADLHVTTIYPHVLCEYIIQIFILKFEIGSLDRMQKQENIMEYEQICNEINQQLIYLYELFEEELQVGLLFYKVETSRNFKQTNEVIQLENSSSTQSQILTARHQPQKQSFYQFSYMSKGDDYNENHINPVQNNSENLQQFIKGFVGKIMFFIDVSRYLESYFQKHFLLKAALIKARSSYKSYFYIPIVIILSIPVYMYFGLVEGFNPMIVNVLGIKVTYSRLITVVLVQLVCASALQFMVCFSVFISAYKLSNNKNSSYNDAYVNILNFNNQRTLNYPKIKLGRKFAFYIYQNIYYLSHLQIHSGISALSVSPQQGNYQSYLFMLTMPIFYNIVFQQFLSSILAIPEEFVSINFMLMIFHNTVYILIGMLFWSVDFAFMIFVVLIMLIFHYFQLREFICFGKQQEYNFNMLKMKNKTLYNKFSSFNMLVYNILASKYVVLNNIIESNYVIRRARIVEENQDDLSMKISFYEKIYHHLTAMKDKYQRRTCLINYPQIVIAIFEPSGDWDYDKQIEYDDFISSSPQLYQVPLKAPNVCCFVESASTQHLHNAFQVILAFSEGVRKRFKFSHTAISSDSLCIYVLYSGKIHISSRAIQVCYELPNIPGILVDGELFRQYKQADAKFRREISNRIKRSGDQAEQERLAALIVHLQISYIENGRGVVVTLKQ